MTIIVVMVIPWKFYTFVRFLVRVSYLEIYNEEVRDLLGKDQMQRLEVCIFLVLNSLQVFFTARLCLNSCAGDVIFF